jgi:hypothetical protein
MPSGGYRLEGQEIEACDCSSICPCVFGEEPEHGSCVGILARHITTGEIDGTDVSGLTWLEVFQSPGHQLKGGTNKLVFIDREASLDQLSALRDAFHGRHGGPLEDLAKLTGEWLGLVQAEVACEVHEGEGRIAVAGKLRTVISQRRGPDETPTTLRDAFFSTIPGSPSWVAKSRELTVVVPEHGLQFAFEGRSAIQSDFRYAT